MVLIGGATGSDGIFYAMRTTIDAAGRVVIPKQIRERHRLRGGEEIEIEDDMDGIRIRRAPREVPLVKGEDGLLVAERSADLPKYGVEEVREILEQARQRRF